MRLTPRKRLLVDPKVQGSLLIRAGAYWCFYAIAITEILLSWNIISGPDGPFIGYFRFGQLWEEHGVVMIASLLILPIMLLDALYISNRFVGPIYRMRRTMRAIAAGENVGPLQFRKGDFRLELADEINAVAAYVEELKRQGVAANKSTPANSEHECGTVTHA